MGLWVIQGGYPLYGTVRVQGSVNAALPILAATLVHKGVSVLTRVPRVRDVDDTLDLLRRLHCKVTREGETVTVDSTTAEMSDLDGSAGKQLRSSVLFLGAMLARFGEAAVPVPKDCVLGPRPIDLHLHALEQLGADVSLMEYGIVCGKCTMDGGEVHFSYPSVGATENALLAACGCKGETVLHNCAKEPEVQDLALFLRGCGHCVLGAGTDTIYVKPHEKEPERIQHRLIPDRIAAAALLCAVAACGGKVTLEEVIYTHLHPILDVLEEMGCNIKMQGTAVTLQSSGTLWVPAHAIVTGGYPAFSTDAQPAMLAACLRGDGVTVVEDRVFPKRLAYTKQLRQFGADLVLTEDCTAVVTGVPHLQGANVRVHDLRSGAAMVIAALQAEGLSRIIDDGILCRGYEFFDAALRMLGAKIEFTE